MKRILAILGLVLLAPMLSFGDQYDKTWVRQRHRYNDELYLASHVALTGTWTCAANSQVCTEDTGGAAGTADTELTIGDTIIMQSGSYWYSYEVANVAITATKFYRVESVSDTTTDPLRAVSASTVYIVNTGVTTTEVTLRDGAGNALPLGLSTTQIWLDGSVNFATGKEFILEGTAAVNFFNYHNGTNPYFAIGDGSGVNISDITGRFVVGSGTAAAPSLALKDSGGAVTDGFYSLDANRIGVSLNGAIVWQMGSSFLGGGAAGSPYFVNAASSATVPNIVPDGGDANTGFSGGASGDDGQISFISDGTEIVHIDSPGVDVVGRLSSTTPVVGELYYDGAGATITVTTAGTFYGMTDFVQGTVAGAGYVTSDVADATSDHLIIGASGAGTYMVNISASFDGPALAVLECHLFKGATEVSNVGFYRTIGAASAVGSASASGIAVLAAADEPNVRCTSDTDSDEIVFESLNLLIYRLN